MNTLISLANLAKTFGIYDISCYTFGAMLSTLHTMHNEGTDISSLISLETNLNCYDDDTWGIAIAESEYYGLIRISNGDEALCLPIPMLTLKAQEFLLEVQGVKCFARFQHNRRLFHFDDEKRNAAKRDIERRIIDILPEWENIKSNASEYVDF